MGAARCPAGEKVQLLLRRTVSGRGVCDQYQVFARQFKGVTGKRQVSYDWVVDVFCSGPVMADVVMRPSCPECVATSCELTDEVAELPVEGVAPGFDPQRSHGVVSDSVPVQIQILGAAVEKHEPRQVQRQGLRRYDARIQGEALLVGGQDVEAAIAQVRRRRKGIEDSVDTRPHCAAAGPPGRPCRGARRSREVEEVLPLGVVKVEGAGKGLEHRLGNTGEVPALQARVVLDAHSGELSHLGPAQAGHPSLLPVRGQARRLGGDPGTAGGQELADLGAVVHGSTVERDRRARGALALPLKAVTPALGLAGGLSLVGHRGPMKKADMTMTLKPANPAEVTLAETAGNRRHKRAAIGLAMLGFAVVALDAQITNVALPAIHHSLGGGLAGLQWIVTGYTLMFSALLLFGGTLADRVGSKNSYRNGMVLFVAASAACGLAPSLPFLVAARIVQGTGAALVTPTSLSLIREAFEDSRERARAIALWAMGGSVAAAAGPVLGGLLTQVDWRLIFLVNLPVGLAAIGFLAQAAPSPRRAGRFDWTGQVTAVLALGALTYGLIEGGSASFGASRVIAAFLIAAASFTVFLFAERRGRHPMVPLTLFRSRTVVFTLSVAFVTMAGFYGTVFLQSLYFQQQRGQSAVATGLLFLPMTSLVALTNPLVGKIAHRYGRILPIVAGQAGMASGLLVLALIPLHAPILAVALVMILVGVGGAFTVPPIASLILDSVAGQIGGTASGVLNTFRQMGGSLGVAVFGAVVDSSSTFEHGLRLSFAGTAVLVAIAAASTLALRTSAREYSTIK
jgi:MFS transporter, DHA2 family, methylenomycin A resistance protein